MERLPKYRSKIKLAIMNLSMILQILWNLKKRAQFWKKCYYTYSPDSFLKNLDELKEKKGINNFWKEEQYKEWRKDIKKHPEKVGKLHITENSFTFEFNDKNKWLKLKKHLIFMQRMGIAKINLYTHKDSIQVFCYNKLKKKKLWQIKNYFFLQNKH